MTADASLVTLEALLRRNAVRHPDRPALADPPDRPAICGDAPRALSWREAERDVEAIANLLRQSGLPAGSVVALQLPNVVESVLAPLAVMRAGMVPALLPLLWRQGEGILALVRVHAKALVVCSRVGAFDHGALAMDIAAELFPIRILFGFGAGLPDGIVRLHEAAAAPPSAPAAPEASGAQEVLTFDVGADGPLTFRRSCGELLAAGLLVKERAAIPDGGIALSTVPVASFAGMASVLVPWLLCGGTLALHHPFDPELLAGQVQHHRPHVLTVPDTILPLLAEADFCERDFPNTILSIARAPERTRHAPPWRRDIRLLDIAAFGEVALLAQLRPPDGRFSGWRAGPVVVGKGESATQIAHIEMTPHGTLGVRGALARSPARDDYAPQQVRAAHEGVVDTQHPCAPAEDLDVLVVTAGPPGITRVGGYSFVMPQLQNAVQEHDRAALIAALPHALCGQRLAGHCADPDAMQGRLLAQGANPLVVQAFSARDASPA